MSKQAFDYEDDGDPRDESTGPPREQVERVRRAIFNVLSGEAEVNTGMLLAAVYDALGYPGIDYPPDCTAPPAFPRGLEQAAALTLPGGAQEAGIHLATAGDRCACIADHFATEWQRASDNSPTTPQGEVFRSVAAEVARQFAGCATQIRVLKFEDIAAPSLQPQT